VSESASPPGAEHHDRDTAARPYESASRTHASLYKLSSVIEQSPKTHLLKHICQMPLAEVNSTERASLE